MKRFLFVFVLMNLMFSSAVCQTENATKAEETIEDPAEYDSDDYEEDETYPYERDIEAPAEYIPEEMEEGQAYNFDEHFDSLKLGKLNLSKTTLDSADWVDLVGDMNFSKKPKPVEQKLKEKKSWSLPKPTSFLGLGQVLLIVVIILVLIGIIFLIYRQIQRQDVRLKEDDVWWQIDLENSESAETIITSRLQDALKNGEYAIAIRLHYLQALNDLNRKGFILWKKDKTNAEYIRQLKSSNFQSDFRQLTRWFERAWFGKKSTGIETYTAFYKVFESFIVLLERESIKKEEA